MPNLRSTNPATLHFSGKMLITSAFLSGASRDRTGDLLLAKSQRPLLAAVRLPIDPVSTGFTPKLQIV
jgi:hypothetical protein